MKDKTDKKTVEYMIKNGLEKYTKTMEEKQEKKNNLIIYNIPESEKEEPEYLVFKYFACLYKNDSL